MLSKQPSLQSEFSPILKITVLTLLVIKINAKIRESMSAWHHYQDKTE